MEILFCSHTKSNELLVTTLLPMTWQLWGCDRMIKTCITAKLNFLLNVNCEWKIVSEYIPSTILAEHMPTFELEKVPPISPHRKAIGCLLWVTWEKNYQQVSGEQWIIGNIMYGAKVSTSEHGQPWGQLCWDHGWGQLSADGSESLFPGG